MRKQARAHFRGIDDTTGLVTRDMITLPLKRWKGNPIGVMNVLNKRRGTLNENDLALLTIISAFAALAIEQARLFEEAKMAEVVRLLGSIGHDLKNLLQPIVTGTWVLGEELDEMFADSSGPGPEKRRIGTAFGEELLSAVTSHLRDRIRGFSSERPAADPHAELHDLTLHVESGIGLLEAKIKDAMEVPALSGATTDSAENVCRDVLAMIRRSTQRIHDRVKDIADCVKGLSTAPAFRPCRLMDVVREVFETLDILAKENDISLVIEGLDWWSRSRARCGHHIRSRYRRRHASRSLRTAFQCAGRHHEARRDGARNENRQRCRRRTPGSDHCQQRDWAWNNFSDSASYRSNAGARVTCTVRATLE